MTGQKFHYDEELSRSQKVVALAPDMIAQRQCIHHALNLQPGERVLDIGSGNGIMVQEMAEAVGPDGLSAGVDAAETMTSMARAHCRHLTNAHLETAHADRLPFENHSFDVVTSAQCLSYASDVPVILFEINRVLKPGGRLVILETDWASLVWNCSNRHLMDKIMAGYLNIYTNPHLPRTLSHQLTDTGFAVTNRSSFPIVNWTHAPDTFAGLQIGFVRSQAESKEFVTAEELQMWLDDLRETERLCECFFSLNRYLFSASKSSSQ